MKKILIVLALVLSGVAGAQTSAASSKGYEELTSRLLGWGGFNFPEVVVGKLPDLGFEIPVPEGARVLGYIKRDTGDAGSYEIVLDAKQKPDDVVAFVKTKLSGSWEIQPTQVFGPVMFREPGMNANDPTNPYRMLNACRAKTGLNSVQVTAFNSGTPITDVRIRVDSWTCEFTGSADTSHLPKLNLPKNAEISRMDTSVGGVFGRIEQVNLQTDSNTFDIHEHFAGEMQRNNWTKLAAAMLGPIPQSLWGIKDAAGKDHILTLACREVAPKTVACTILVLQ